MTKPDLSNIDERIAEWHESLSRNQFINPNFFDESPQHEE